MSSIRLFGYVVRVRAAALLTGTVVSLFMVSGSALYNMWLIQTRQVSHSAGFVPAKRLTTNFEREILNARIFFIYYVTIQKPGAYEKGWEHYRQVESSLAQLTALVAKRDDLETLKSPVAKLQADLDSYRIALTATLSMVQSGVLGGPVYDAQVKEWAARGAVLVTDAGNVEKLAFAKSEADSSRAVATVTQGEMLVLAGLLAGLLACLAISLRIHRPEQANTGIALAQGPGGVTH